MAEYVNENNPIIIKNETDSDINVGVGVVFRKSGIYEITITDSTITVTKVSERKTGQWIDRNDNVATCSECGKRWGLYRMLKYCPNCGARMDGNDDER